MTRHERKVAQRIRLARFCKDAVQIARAEGWDAFEASCDPDGIEVGFAPVARAFPVVIRRVGTLSNDGRDFPAVRYRAGLLS